MIFEPLLERWALIYQKEKRGKAFSQKRVAHANAGELLIQCVIEDYVIPWERGHDLWSGGQW